MSTLSSKLQTGGGAVYMVNAYGVKAGMVCLQCKNCVIHNWALQRWASYNGALKYKSIFWLTYLLLTYLPTFSSCFTDLRLMFWPASQGSQSNLLVQHVATRRKRLSIPSRVLTVCPVKPAISLEMILILVFSSSTVCLQTFYRAAANLVLRDTWRQFNACFHSA